MFEQLVVIEPIRFAIAFQAKGIISRLHGNCGNSLPCMCYTRKSTRKPFRFTHALFEFGNLFR